MINRVNAAGWAVFEKLTSGQGNQLDLNTTYALDKRAGQTDNLGSIVTVLSGASFVMASGSLINFQSGSLLNVSSGASLTLATGAVVTANANISFNGTSTVNSTGVFNFASGSSFNTASGSNFTLAAGTVTTISSTVNFTATSNFGIFSTANFYGVLNAVAGSSVVNLNNIVNFGSSSVTTFNSGGTVTFNSTVLQGSILTDLTINPFSQITFSNTGLQGTVFTNLHLISGSQLTFDAGTGISFSGTTQTTSGSTFTFNGPTVMTGSLTATTSPVTVANFTLTGANKVKLVSRTYTRKVSSLMHRSVSANWSALPGGNFATAVNTLNVGFFPIIVPSGAIISSIRLYILPSGPHVNMPGNLPAIQLTSMSGGSSSTIASQTDTSANLAAYDVYHSITLSGLNYTVNNSAEALRLMIFTEYGTNATSGFQVWDAEVTFSVTSIDDGFIG